MDNFSILWESLLKGGTKVLERISSYGRSIIVQAKYLLNEIINLCQTIPDKIIISREEYILLIALCIALILNTASSNRNNKQNPDSQKENAKRNVREVKRQSPKVLGKTWYPTGWTYNEAKKLWEPPDFLGAEAKDRWVWDPEKEVWIDLYKEKKEK